MFYFVQYDNCGKAEMLRQAQHDKRRAFDPNGKQVLRPPLSAKQRLEAMVRCLMTFLSAEMLRQAQHDSIKQSGCFVALNIIGLRPQTRGLPIDGQVKHIFKEKQ